MAIRLLGIITLAILVLGLAIGYDLANAQKNLDKFNVNDFKIDPSKPSVYLEFEKFGEITPKTSNVPTKVAFLKLSNNTILPIAIDANFDTRFVKAESLSLSDGSLVETVPDNSSVEVCIDVDVIPYTTNKTLDVKDKNKNKVGKSIITDIRLKEKNPAENDKGTCFWSNGWRADEFGNGERIWIRSKQSVSFSVPRKYLKDNLKVSTLFNYEWEFDGKSLNFDEPKHKVYFYGSDMRSDVPASPTARGN